MNNTIIFCEQMTDTSGTGCEENYMYPGKCKNRVCKTKKNAIS